MSPLVMHSRNVFFLNNRVDVFSHSLFVNISLFFSSQHGIIDALEEDDILRQEMPHACR